MAEVCKVSHVGVESFLTRGDDAFLFGPFNLPNFLPDPFRLDVYGGDAGLDRLNSVLLGLVRGLASPFAL